MTNKRIHGFRKKNMEMLLYIGHGHPTVVDGSLDYINPPTIHRNCTKWLVRYVSPASFKFGSVRWCVSVGSLPNPPVDRSTLPACGSQLTCESWWKWMEVRTFSKSWLLQRSVKPVNSKTWINGSSLKPPKPMVSDQHVSWFDEAGVDVVDVGLSENSGKTLIENRIASLKLQLFKRHQLGIPFSGYS